MAEYRLTFGQRYAREPHPTFPAAHPDGWVTIIAPTWSAGRAFASDRFGRHWAFLYAEEEFGATSAWPEPMSVLFPRGELGRFTVDGAGRQTAVSDG